MGTSSDNADSALTVNNYGGDISIYADGIAVTNAANDHGIEVTATAGTTLVEATDVRVNGAMDNGVNATGSASATVTLNIDELDVQNTGSDGLHAEYATLTLSSSTLANNAGSGARLIEGDTTISDTSFNDNAAYGLECEGAGVQACATVLHSANALGEQLGCDATCGEEAEDDDTGTP